MVLGGGTFGRCLDCEDGAHYRVVKKRPGSELVLFLSHEERMRILQSCSNQNSMILAQKQTYGSMEQNREPSGVSIVAQRLMNPLASMRSQV